MATTRRRSPRAAKGTSEPPPEATQATLLDSSSGAVVDGVRRVRVLHSLEDIKAKRGEYMITVNADSFGKSEIIAILSKTSLFGTRLPETLSVGGLADELEGVIAKDPGNIVSIATRVIDARP